MNTGVRQAVDAGQRGYEWNLGQREEVEKQKRGGG